MVIQGAWCRLRCIAADDNELRNLDPYSAGVVHKGVHISNVVTYYVVCSLGGGLRLILVPTD
jgi:hypothetical protein